MPLLPSQGLCKASSSWNPPVQSWRPCLAILLREALSDFSLLQGLISSCQDLPTSLTPCPGCDALRGTMPLQASSHAPGTMHSTQQVLIMCSIC